MCTLFPKKKKKSTENKTNSKDVKLNEPQKKKLLQHQNNSVSSIIYCNNHLYGRICELSNAQFLLDSKRIHTSSTMTIIYI